MADEEIYYEQTVNTMVVMAECLNKLAQRIDYTGDTTMNTRLDMAIKELAHGVYAATLAVKIKMEHPNG